MASKDLRVNVIFDAKTKELDKMFERINKMQANLNRQASAQNNVTKAVNKTNKAYKKSGDLIDSVTSKVKSLASAYLGVMGATATLNASDTITRAENKLNNLNGGNTAATQKQLDQMYTSAQKVRMGYGDMMNNVSKSMMLAGEAFGGSMDNAIRFQEVMAEAYAIGGASAAEMSSSMYQMIQALGSGILQGDELRSVREGAPLAYKEIEKLAQEIYGADENLKDLASQGKITSDIVVKAMLKAGTTMDEAFAKTNMTFADAWTKTKNTALKAFEPALRKLNKALQKFNDAGVFEDMAIIFRGFSLVLQVVADALGVVADNLYWLRPILIAIALIAGIVVGKLLLMAAAAGWAGLMAKIAGNQAFMAWLKAVWPIFLIIGAIAILIAILSKLGVSFSEVCGSIVGALFWVGAVVINIGIAIINMVTGLVVAVVLAAENIGIAFYNCWQSATAYFWDFVGNLLDGTGIVAKAVSAIAGAFGLDAVSIEAKANTARSKIKEYNSWSDIGSGFSTLDYVDPNEYFNKGYGLGEHFGNWTTGKVNEFLNVDGLLGNINPDLDAIKGNTGRIADSMELSEEDLSYLKDVAHMEWKKEFTTANIKVDMTNNNNVDKDFDLNSLAIGLRNLVEEEMFAVANGVYA